MDGVSRDGRSALERLVTLVFGSGVRSTSEDYPVSYSF